MTDQRSLGESRAREGGVPEACPECDGQLVDDEGKAETRCADCGLVVSDDQVDPRPEWRAFGAAEREENQGSGRRRRR